MTWKRPPARPVKKIEGSIGPRPVAPAVGLLDAVSMLRSAGLNVPARVPPSPHAKDARGRLIRESARGKECQVRYIGVCTHNPEKTIWSHARWGARLGEGGRGMSTKADDLAGAYACTDCDAAYDGQRKMPEYYDRVSLDLDWCMGHFRSLSILQRDGLI